MFRRDVDAIVKDVAAIISFFLLSIHPWNKGSFLFAPCSPNMGRFQK